MHHDALSRLLSDFAGNKNTLNVYFRTLNNNKLVTLGKEMLNGMSHLRTLKLSDNAFACDCHLAWLSSHLRAHPRLGQHTRCASPVHLKERNLVDLQVSLTDQRLADSPNLRALVSLSNYILP